MKKYFSIACWIMVFEAISATIGYATQPGVDGWYQSLKEAPLTPPDFVFPIMWTILYALIAISGYLLWRDRTQAGGEKRFALFALYMGFNWTWSFIFFSLHMLFLSFIWIIAMNGIAIFLIFKAWTINRKVALLMIPPLVWTLFASYLNGAYWFLNS